MAKAEAGKEAANAVNDPTNGAEHTIDLSRPYVAQVTIAGLSALIFHRWNCEAVAAKAGAAKGSRAKKSDDLETYVWRDSEGQLCLPGEYLRQSCIHAAKYQQDPRSPRKSAMDLFKAGVVALTELGPLGPDAPKNTWDYEHAAGVQIQRNRVTRIRPAFRAGWTASIDIAVLLPEYIKPELLHMTLTDAGRLCGVGDYRPTYGRFRVTSFQVVAE